MPQPPKAKVNALLSAIAQQGKPARATPAKPPAAKAAKHQTPEQAARPRATPAATAPGRYSSIYLTGEDQKILQEFLVWFASQGRKINDSLLIRAALRSIRPGSDLLAAYGEALHSDRRFKKKA